MAPSPVLLSTQSLRVSNDPTPSPSHSTPSRSNDRVATHRREVGCGEEVTEQIVLEIAREFADAELEERYMKFKALQAMQHTRTQQDTHTQHTHTRTHMHTRLQRAAMHFIAPSACQIPM